MVPTNCIAKIHIGGCIPINPLAEGAALIIVPGRGQSLLPCSLIYLTKVDISAADVTQCDGLHLIYVLKARRTKLGCPTVLNFVHETLKPCYTTL